MDLYIAAPPQIYAALAAEGAHRDHREKVYIPPANDIPAKKRAPSAGIDAGNAARKPRSARRSQFGRISCEYAIARWPFVLLLPDFCRAFLFDPDTRAGGSPLILAGRNLTLYIRISTWRA